MAERKLEVKILGDSRSLERAFGRSARASDTFGRKLGRGAGKGLLLVGKGAAIAGAAVGIGLALALKKGVDGLGDMQKVMAQTDAALKSTKNAAKTSAEEIRGLAESIESKTGIDADAIQSGQNLLLTFTKIRNEAGKNNDIFNQASKTAVDLSVAFGTDMKSASIQLGKALNDPVKGVTALQRSGISFTQAQKDQIKALVESGDVLKAQKLILAEVNTQVGGSAEAYGKTFPGQIERAKRAFEGLTETLAGPFMGILSESLEGLLGFANDPNVQAGLKRFAEGLARTLGQVVGWIRQNWPQIKSIVLTVFGALKQYYETIVIPVFSGVISILGRVVGFVQQNMPQIRAAVQAAFEWIKTNVVPTVQSVARNVQRFVTMMTTFWRNHGDDIKAIIGPVFNTIKIIVSTVLGNIKSVVEMILALIRGDFDKAGEAFKDIMRRSFGALKAIATVGLRVVVAVVKILAREIVEKLSAGLAALKRKVREKFNDAKEAISNTKDAIVQRAKEVGREIINGIVSGISELADRVRQELSDAVGGAIDWVKRNVTRSESPSKVTRDELGRPMADGVAVGIRRGAKNIKQALSDAVKAAVFDARANLASLGGGLAGMLTRLNDARIGGMTSGGALTGGLTLAQIRAQQAKVQRERDKARLEDAVANAESDDERRQAEQELNDWLIEDEARTLEESMQQQQRSYEEEIANLVESFNTGAESAETFRQKLEGIIGGQSGAALGAAFAGEFERQLESIWAQIAALGGTPLGVAGPGVTRPSSVAAAELREWQQARAARLKELEERARGEDTDGGKKITAKERKRINEQMRKWDANNKRPKQLADGGVLRRAVLAGEAGPEAVLPLSSGRAQRMLAEAMDGADKLRGASGGNTIIHVTVNGNEFSAHEFARKIAPELRRQVAFTRSV